MVTEVKDIFVIFFTEQLPLDLFFWFQLSCFKINNQVGFEAKSTSKSMVPGNSAFYPKNMIDLLDMPDSNGKYHLYLLLRTNCHPKNPTKYPNLVPLPDCRSNFRKLL